MTGALALTARRIRAPAGLPRGVAAVLTALVAGPLAAGCVPIGGGTGAGLQEPEVGQCYDTPDAVLPDAHDPSAPVDCAQPHTLETYAVLHPDGPLDRRTLARMDQQCMRRMRDFLGGGFLHTAVSVYYFSPTPAQRADGAGWVRCDAGVVVDTAVSGARRVTGSLAGAFADGVPMAYRRCLNALPDPTAGQPLVPCVQPHLAQQMPTGVALGRPGTPYAGMARLTAQAQPRCAEAVRAALPDAGRSLVVVPTAQMWRSGITTAQCWGLAAPGERLNESEAQPA